MLLLEHLIFASPRLTRRVLQQQQQQKQQQHTFDLGSPTREKQKRRSDGVRRETSVGVLRPHL